MKEIPVYGGLVALVDNEDEALVRQYKWHQKVDSSTTYARSTISNPRRVSLAMHRLILGDPAGVQVDHRDHNGLNNQRSNLRLATTAQNAFNVQKRRTCRGVVTLSRFKGVTWERRRSRWKARIKINGVVRYLGTFVTEIEAALAYNKAATETFGEYANVNTFACPPDASAGITSST